jgi:hypothetical protein
VSLHQQGVLQPNSTNMVAQITRAEFRPKLMAKADGLERLSWFGQYLQNSEQRMFVSAPTTCSRRCSKAYTIDQYNLRVQKELSYSWARKSLNKRIPQSSAELTRVQAKNNGRTYMRFEAYACTAVFLASLFFLYHHELTNLNCCQSILQIRN